METIDVSDWRNGRKAGGLQILVLVLCAVAVSFEGFDAQNIGYVAPAIIRDWHVAAHDFTTVFVSCLVGLLVGLCIAPLADWLGRRKILIGTLTAFGLCSLASTQAASSSCRASSHYRSRTEQKCRQGAIAPPSEQKQRG
jgi:MFS transporter, AAHS family, 4-hydroxybenzoate transporter